MSGYAKRLTGIVIGTAIVCVLLGLYIGLYVTSQPGSAAAAQSPTGAHLYLGTVPAVEGTDPHPSWVSYYAVDAAEPQLAPRHHLRAARQLGRARHGLQLRRAERVAQPLHLAGRRDRRAAPSRSTASRPRRSVPTPRRTSSPSRSWACSCRSKALPTTPRTSARNAPCGLDTAHTTTTFTFHTGKPGLYRWQCFVPCAAGYIAGWGGPMQTVGYMDGFIKVV